MRNFETIEPAPVTLVTDETFNCGHECRSIGQRYDASTVMHAGGLPLCGNCKLHPSNQSYHVCANRTQQSLAAWLAHETERIEQRRLVLTAQRMAAE